MARHLEPQQLPPAVDQKREQSLKGPGRNHKKSMAALEAGKPYNDATVTCSVSYFSFCAIERCCLRWGIVFAAHFFRSALSPLLEYASNSATAEKKTH
jgi:hypothetical protein